jgi:hypothetical protein
MSNQNPFDVDINRKPANVDLHRSPEKIIADLAKRGRDANDQWSANFTGPVIIEFGALLVKLSQQAERDSKKITRLTWVITVLTGVLVFLAIPPLFEVVRKWF